MSSVRVRIAPSPTGVPHVGTAYIALFNYCFAKAKGGTFVLRIEDTDQTRSKAGHERTIMEALRWTGLQWDEGPDKDGDYGPYRQSERSAIYREYAQKLLDQGHAYKCYLTAEQLDQIRQRGLRADDPEFQPSTEEIEAFETSGAPYTVRLRIPTEGICNINDVLRGTVSFDYKTIDPQVLLKSDGYPTYHLANVVDDHLMKITHVIRGEEWLPSLPKHLLLYQYFGWQPPQVIHLPLLRNSDGSKLSKRKNPTSILFYKETGILPEALLNFLGTMAYSMPDQQEVFSLDEMVAGFDIERVRLGGPIFDQNKLRWICQQHIAGLSQEALLQRLTQWRFNESYLAKLLPIMKPRLHRLGDFMEVCDFMFYSDVKFDREAPVPKGKTPEDTRDFLQKLVWEMEALEAFNAPAIEAAIQKVAQLHQWTVREAAHATRISVCGKTVAPPLYQVMEILGSDVSRSRLSAAVALIEPLGKKKIAKLQKAYAAACANYQQPTTAS